MTLQPPPDVLERTPIFRMIHIDCLNTLLRRDALHAPSCVPSDGLPYRSIHAVQTQADRGNKAVPCGPRGFIRDYVGFYFGPRSPMLNRIRTGWSVERVAQTEILYLVSSAQAVANAGLRFVFTDRHSLTAVAVWRNRLADLSIVDFPTAYATWWNTKPDHPDRQEKKQAEFLVHRSMPWNLIDRIGVRDAGAADRVRAILDRYPRIHRPNIQPERLWYYQDGATADD